MSKKAIHITAVVLIIIGAINWGLIGLGDLTSSGRNWNIINVVLGNIPTLESVIYILIGVAGILKLIHIFKK